MKKLLSIVLALVMLMACAAPALADEGSEPDWTEYDALVAEIKSTTDFVEREALLHKAEDMLMATYAVVPLYYYNDLYMQKSNVDGIYANLFQTKFFAYATKTGDDADTLRVNLASEPDFLYPALNRTAPAWPRWASPACTPMTPPALWFPLWRKATRCPKTV